MRLRLNLALLLALCAVSAQAGLISVSGSRAVASTGGSSTAIGTYISGLSSGVWSARSDTGGFNTWTGFNDTLTLHVLTGGTVTEYVATGPWDPIHLQIDVSGTTHGSNPDYQSRWIQYDAATNAWSNTNTAPIANGTVQHGFQLNAINPVDGRYFYRFYFGPTPLLVWSGSAWLSAASDPFSNSIPVIVANPAANSGNGAIIYGSDSGFGGYTYSAGSPGAGSWTSYSMSSPFCGGCYYTGGFYDPASQATFFFNRNSSTQGVKVTASGVVSTISVTMPSTVGVITSDGSYGIPIDGYTTPGSVQRKPMMIEPGVGMWEFNSSNNTFTSLGVTPPSNFASGGPGGWFTAMSTYDTILFVSVNSDGIPHAWFYKR